MERRVWLIGGTSESAQLAQALVQVHLPSVVTVTTEPARRLYQSAPNLRVVVTRFDAETLPLFLKQAAIAAILDASHPFATDISRLAIAAADQHGLPYLRFERPLPDGPGSPNEHWLESFETLLEGNELAGERVLLTVGYRPLPLFAAWQERATLFARILPSIMALQTALKAGFVPERLLALRPPVPLALERALWQHWHISRVVTKASGQPGGEDTKRQLAAELGIRLIVIARPAIGYPQQTSDLEVALQFCRRCVGG